MTPRLRRIDVVPALFIAGLTRRELNWLAKRLPHTANGDYLATTVNELQRAVELIYERRPAACLTLANRHGVLTLRPASVVIRIQEGATR